MCAYECVCVCARAPVCADAHTFLRRYEIVPVFFQMVQRDCMKRSLLLLIPHSKVIRLAGTIEQ